MMDQTHKEVYFHEYCKTCKHEELDENKDPCDECLAYPENADSHRPVNWEAKDEYEREEEGEGR